MFFFFSKNIVSLKRKKNFACPGQNAPKYSGNDMFFVDDIVDSLSPKILISG